MATDNSVSLVGNVTRDPELRFTPSGQATTSFGLAVNRRWQNKQTQEWEEAVSFFDVVVWREMAENVAESLTKGSRAFVMGRLEQRTWDDKETGNPRTKIEVIADEVGPSLRWATADVTRNERKDGGSGGSKGGDSGGGGGNRGGTGSGGGGRRPAPKQEYDPDEEPF